MKKSTLLLIPAVALLGLCAVESASAALTYVSENYNMSVATSSVDVELTENGETIANGEKLLTNLISEGEAFHIGQKYNEDIAVLNTGKYDSYVRVILTKSWLNSDGTKNTSLDPSLIDLEINTDNGWTVDNSASTDEQIVLYYEQVVKSGETTPNVVDSVTVLNDITSKVTKHGTTGNITTTYDYTGKSFSIEAEVNAVQTHNAQEAIYSAWGVTTNVTDSGELLLADKLVAKDANVIKNDTNWEVDFDGDKISSNFQSDAVADAISDAMPGDVLSFKVDITNKDENASNWYITNSVIKSLEDDSNASGGAYSYTLNYVDNDGNAKVLFDSDTIGGDDASIEGLHQATNSTDTYFYLDNLEKDEKGYVELAIKLDGKTQNNNYQSTLASMEMSFAVEKASAPGKNDDSEDDPDEPDKPDKPEEEDVITPKTGDNNSMMISIITLTLGLGLIGVWFVSEKKRKQQKGDA